MQFLGTYSQHLGVGARASAFVTTVMEGQGVLVPADPSPALTSRDVG